ncbi:MAG: prolyl oligopeptidase family serine peptidase [Sphingomonas sp.]
MAASVVLSLLAPASAPGQAASRQDEFDYLIPQFGERALDWASKQTEATRARLKASPNFAAVLADMEAVQARARPLPTYFLLGGRRFLRVVRSQSQPYGRIEAADADRSGRPGDWRTVFDLDAYNRTQSVPSTIKWLSPEQECRPPVYDRCMIPLYRAGGQDNGFVEIDLVTGTIVKDGFHLEPGRNFVGWFDRDQLVVAHTTEGAPSLPSQFPAELKIWKRGSPLRQARTIFRTDPQDSLFEFRVSGPAERRRIIVNVAKSYSRFRIKEISLAGAVRDIPLPEALANFGTPQISGRYLAVQLDEAATVDGQAYPADSILSYDLDSRRITAIMTPPAGVYLTGGFVATRSGFAIVGVRDLRRIVYSAIPVAGRWAVSERYTERPGLTLRLASDSWSDTLLLREEGLLTPARYALLSRGAPTVIDTAEPQADLVGYVVDVRSARSKDGTLVDYYLMHKAGRDSGPVPTIVQGYGGFGVSNDPAYLCCRLGTSWKSWFDRGGALAITAIRGGGERGGAWHRDATGIHRIRSFEDFIAVAQDLQRSGFTDARHLGMLGHSEGGQLTAGVAVMRPDLFAAALIGAPVTDNAIVGHGDGGISAGMASEEGDWNDPAERKFIEAWDPYSNIRPGTAYPAMLVVVATTDNQVGPSHARRFVARMQKVGAPALLLEGRDGGHDYPDPLTQTADAALQMSFFLDTLMPAH